MIKWSITSLQGQNLQQGQTMVPAGRIELPIDLTGLPKGVYLFRCYLDWHAPILERIIVE